MDKKIEKRPKSTIFITCEVIITECMICLLFYNSLRDMVMQNQEIKISQFLVEWEKKLFVSGKIDYLTINQLKKFVQQEQVEDNFLTWVAIWWAYKGSADCDIERMMYEKAETLIELLALKVTLQGVNIFELGMPLSNDALEEMSGVVARLGEGLNIGNNLLELLEQINRKNPISIRELVNQSIESGEKIKYVQSIKEEVHEQVPYIVTNLMHAKSMFDNYVDLSNSDNGIDKINAEGLIYAMQDMFASSFLAQYMITKNPYLLEYLHALDNGFEKSTSYYQKNLEKAINYEMKAIKNKKKEVAKQSKNLLLIKNEIKVLNEQLRIQKDIQRDLLIKLHGLEYQVGSSQMKSKKNQISNLEYKIQSLQGIVKQIDRKLEKHSKYGKSAQLSKSQLIQLNNEKVKILSELDNLFIRNNKYILELEKLSSEFKEDNSKIISELREQLDKINSGIAEFENKINKLKQFLC